MLKQHEPDRGAKHDGSSQHRSPGELSPSLGAGHSADEPGRLEFVETFEPPTTRPNLNYFAHPRALARARLLSG
jgi:hypothetical protein